MDVGVTVVDVVEEGATVVVVVVLRESRSRVRLVRRPSCRGLLLVVPLSSSVVDVDEVGVAVAPGAVQLPCCSSGAVVEVEVVGTVVEVDVLVDVVLSCERRPSSLRASSDTVRPWHGPGRVSWATPETSSPWLSWAVVDVDDVLEVGWATAPTPDGPARPTGGRGAGADAAGGKVDVVVVVGRSSSTWMPTFWSTTETGWDSEPVAAAAPVAEIASTAAATAALVDKTRATRWRER